MRTRRAAAALPLVAFAALAACRNSCSSPPPAQGESMPTATPLAAPLDSNRAVPEALPRCRADGPSVVAPGEDVVVGDAVTTPTQIAVGAVRRDGSKRVASVLVAPLDLSSLKAIDVGPSLGDDPPPALRVHDGALYAAFFARKTGADAGAAQKLPVGTPLVTREMHVVKIEAAASPPIGVVTQHADESFAVDLAWTKGNPSPLVAWDEDAPVPEGKLGADRGLVKVQVLGEGAHTVSPETSDAESPRLLAKADGYWLAWLAKKPEHAAGGAKSDGGGDASYEPEGAGESRSHRWVEVVALDAKGRETSPVRRVTSEKGHVLAFELAASANGHAQLLVQDEAAATEGAGGRITRYGLRDSGDKPESSDLVDAGVGRALAELGLGGATEPRWLAWTDTAERVHVVPLASPVALAGLPSLEPAFEGSRLLAEGTGAFVYAATFGPSAVSIRRFNCAP